MKRAEGPELCSLGQSDRRERRPRLIKQTLGKCPSPAVCSGSFPQQGRGGGAGERPGEVARSAGGGGYILQASALGRCPETIMPRCGGGRKCDNQTS